jgi:Ca-activated chloride channel homolog
VPLLKQVSQPQAFALQEPYWLRDQPAVVSPKPQTKPTEPAQANKTPLPEPPAGEPRPEPVVVVKETIIRDTVFIRDTVYLEKPPAITPSFYDLKDAPPNNLTLLLDVSSSMNAPDRLPLLRQAARRLVGLLRPEDDLAIVVYSGQAQVWLPSTSGREQDKILQALDRLEPSGYTDANMGLALAYRVANKNFKSVGNNRIVLATDGEFGLRPNVLELVDRNAAKGIALTIFKFGDKPTPSLRRISDLGQGNLVSISAQNADAFMVQEAKGRKK